MSDRCAGEEEVYVPHKCLQEHAARVRQADCARGGQYVEAGSGSGLSVKRSASRQKRSGRAFSVVRLEGMMFWRLRKRASDTVNSSEDIIE